MSHKDCPENRIIVLREFDIGFVFAHPSLCSYSIWCTAPACRRRLASNTSYLSRTFLLQVVWVPNTVIRSIVHKNIQWRQLTASRQREFSIATRIFGVSFWPIVVFSAWFCCCGKTILQATSKPFQNLRRILTLPGNDDKKSNNNEKADEYI